VELEEPVETGDGSMQIRPNHSLDVQICVLVLLAVVGEGKDGGEVIGCDVLRLVVGSS